MFEAWQTGQSNVLQSYAVFKQLQNTNKVNLQQIKLADTFVQKKIEDMCLYFFKLKNVMLIYLNIINVIRNITTIFFFGRGSNFNSKEILLLK